MNGRTVIERCPTRWRDTVSDAFVHRCNKLWPHEHEHECACGDRCEQLPPIANPQVAGGES